MKKRSFTRVRAHRKGWALSAADLGRLLGRDPSQVSRLEGGGSPTLSFALGCEVVFGASARIMFPTAYEQMEEQVMERAAKLLLSLEGKHDPRSVRRRELLHDMMKRATDSPGHA